MKKIFKYHIPMDKDGDFFISLPQGYIPRYVGLQPSQGSDPQVWIEIPSPSEPSIYTEFRHFHVFGTGHIIPDDAQYIGTWQDGALTWHLYEVFDTVPGGIEDTT